MKTPRSYLFVPGHKPDLFAKAAASGADTIILDLEDAVGPDQKADARRIVSEWFRTGGGGMVRVNGDGSPWFEDDLAALKDSACETVMVPKATPDAITKAARLLPDKSIVGLIETAEGLAQLRDTVKIPGLSRLAFGNLDFGSDLRIPGTGQELSAARFEIVLASRLGNLVQPIDGVTTELKDQSVLAREVRAARDMGFSAKLCIHPAQVAQVNDLFSPSKAEIDWALRVVEALKQSSGSVVQIDGKMIDAPLERKARQVLSDAEMET